MAEFEMTSLTALKSSIAKIEKRQATERRMQNMRRLYKFVDIMERHGKLIEILLNTTNLLAFVWVFISPIIVLYNYTYLRGQTGANEVFVTSMAYIKPSNRAGAEIMQVASSVSEAFNELLDTYKVIGESIELLENCNGLIDGNHLVKQAVVSMFQDIFEFHQTALAYFRKPSK